MSSREALAERSSCGIGGDIADVLAARLAGAAEVVCLAELDCTAGLTAANNAAISSTDAVSLNCWPTGMVGDAGSDAFAG